MKLKKLLILPAMMLVASNLSGCSLLGVITWVNWDGGVLEEDINFFPGSVPSYDRKGDPTRPSDSQYDYKFIGWDKPTNQRFWGFYETYTAVYEKIERYYTITWLDGNGTTLKQQDLVYGTTATDLFNKHAPNPYKADTAQYHYSFSGWDPQIEDVTKNQVYTPIFDSVTRSYTITFKDEDGSILSQYQLEYGKMPVAPADPKKDPDNDSVYSFAGWNKTLTEVTQDETYTAMYNRRDRGKFRIHYYVNGQIQKENIYQDYAYEYENLALPKYTLGGDYPYYDVEWYTTHDFVAGSRISNYEIRSIGDNIFVYGKTGAVHDFTVEYVLPTGATFPTGHTYPDKVTYYDSYDLDLIDASFKPSLTGYVFAGWLDENNDAVHSIYKTTEDLVLTAKFIPGVFTITFDWPSWAGYEVQATYGTTNYIPNTSGSGGLSDPEKVGYEFKGWSIDGKMPAFSFSKPYSYTSDITLKPIFKPIVYNLKYILNGGHLNPISAPKTYTIETFDDVLPVAEKYGYTFQYWKLDATHKAYPGYSLRDVFGPGPDYFLNGYAKDLTLEAIFEAKVHAITYDFDGGSKVFNVTYKDGDTVLDVVPVAYGVSTAGFKLLNNEVSRHFAGWTDAQGKLILNDEEITSDIILNAKWNDVTQRSIYKPGTTDPELKYDKTIAVNGSETVPLYSENGTYLQVTTLIDQEVTVTSTASFNVWEVAATNQVIYYSAFDSVSYSLALELKAGQSYLIRVSGNKDEISSAVVSVTSATTDQEPHFEISGKDVTQSPVSCAFDEKIPNLYELAKDGYVFDGWFSGTKEYKDGDVLDVDDDLELVAHWHAAP